MAMASLQTQPSSGLGGYGKLTKPRNRIVVKPILKKLHSTHSEKNSLDLDRGWDDQPTVTSPDLEFASLDYGARDIDEIGADRQHLYAPTYAAAPAAGPAKTAKTARDVSFTLSATELGGGGGGSGVVRANTFSASSHARSTSGASVATSNSGRNGSFVHPFQQTPRTSTPPLHSHTNSLSSLDNTLVAPREYSTTIAEGEGDEGDKVDEASFSHQHAKGKKKASHSPNLNPNPPKLRRPSLTSSHRTSSYSDGTSLRATATRTNSAAAVPRLVPTAANHNRSDLHQGSFSSAHDSHLATGASLSLSTQKTTSPSIGASSPISPFRSSLDMNGFRIRSRSEIDTATRQEQVREARRKFEAKEREKEEKYAREQIRKRERADAKEAQKFERAQAQIPRGSFGHISTHSSGRNSFSNREKGEHGQNPTAAAKADDVRFEMPSRSKSAKRKTNGVWTAFVLWLRTRLLKLGRR